MVFVNKLDRDNSCFETVVDQMREKYGTGIVPIHIPIGKEADFRGFVDVITQKAYVLENGKMVEAPIPEDIAVQIDDYRTYLIEVSAESCDELLMKYLEGDEISEQEILSAFRTGIASGDIYPVLCGSALTGIGVEALLDAMLSLLPAPVGEGDIAAEPSALVFKTLADPFVGKLSFLRILSGTFKAADGLYNMNMEQEEKIGSYIVPCGKNQDTRCV